MMDYIFSLHVKCTGMIYILESSPMIYQIYERASRHQLLLKISPVSLMRLSRYLPLPSPHPPPPYCSLPQPAEQPATLHFLATTIKPIKRCSNEWTNPLACGMSYVLLVKHHKEMSSEQFAQYLILHVSRLMIPSMKVESQERFYIPSQILRCK